MVNTGHPSAGCELCRQRKIRCDETKPACRKCTKYGRVCPGYRDVGALSLSKKAKASKSENWKQQPASRSAPDILEHRHAVKSESSDLDYPSFSRSPELCPVRSYDISRSASPTSMYRYPASPSFTSSTTSIESAIHCLFTSRAFAVCAITDPEVDSVAMVKDMYQNTAYGSCLDACTKAAALANLSNRLERSDLHVEARTQYGNAMQALNNTLQSPTDRIADETLLSMLMLRFCEFFFGLSTDATIFGPKSCASDNWLAHLGGALTILRMRGANQLATPQGRWLFDITFRSEICKMLWDCREVDDYLCQLEDQLDMFQAQWMYPLLAIYRYYYRGVFRIRNRVKQLVETAPHRPYPQTLSEINSLVAAVQTLDSELERWRVENPHYEAQVVPEDTKMNQRLPVSLSDGYFSHVKVGMYTRRIQFMQFKLHESLVQGLTCTIQALEHQQGISPTRIVTSASFAAVDRHLAKHLDILHGIGSTLLGSTSYMLGDIDEFGQVIEFEPEHSRCSPFSSGRNSPTTMAGYMKSTSGAGAGGAPTIEVSYEDSRSTTSSTTSSVAEYRKRNYPSRLRTIEAYVNVIQINTCIFLEDIDSEADLSIRTIAGLVMRRGVDELRAS